MPRGTEGGVNDVQYPLTMPKSLKAVVVEAGGVNDVQFFSIPFVRPIFMIFMFLKIGKNFEIIKITTVMVLVASYDPSSTVTILQAQSWSF